MGRGKPANLTTVNLTGGTIEGDVYGGGMGDADTEAKVGSTLVKLNGTETIDPETGEKSYLDDCVVKGNIFGCNNVNGTPLGNATVHIYKTQGYEGHMRTDSEKLDNIDDSQHSYELNAVYGGGNLAAYVPTDLENCKATVIIDGCELTSIKTVYGGGNAASTPATQVDINGTYEIEEVFGGGNGKDDVSYNGGITYIKNPGANVGYKDYTLYNDAGETYDNPAYNTKEKRTGSDIVYGTGAANVNIYGGRVHRVFGGSNTKGNVRITAVTMLEEAGGCEFCVDEAYGGGKEAPMDAEAKLLMACIPGLSAAYGGAQDANIEGGVTLTITNGTFDRVFGGNNLSGTISGPIVVNIEETGCKPIIIGELYGGGNLAGYSVYGYNADKTPKESGSSKLYDDPVVNVRSFTSIGNVFGGGYGESATMVGNPTVNISVTEGEHKETFVGENATTATLRTGNTAAEGGYPVPSHKAGAIGAINNVYGGGNAAKVVGNTNVNIATKIGDYVYMAKHFKAGDSVEGCYTRSGETYTQVAAGTVAEDGTTYYLKRDFKGADIRGNIYGGGNEAKVTGNTNVVVGKKKE